jgi:hypothetical protein
MVNVIMELGSRVPEVVAEMGSPYDDDCTSFPRIRTSLPTLPSSSTLVLRATITKENT